jgi:AcrR family transcriptional regulator
MIRMSDERPAGRYHHGDLRNALVGAATALAREGGPDAVVLREAARRARVSAAAAYHHFASREELVQAVKERSLELLTAEMRSALAQPDAPAGDLAQRAAVARSRLRALGTAYVRFASAEPGMFRLTFAAGGRWPVAGLPGRPGPPGHDHAATDPFQMLSAVLDELAAVGAVPAERRPGLEYVAWAAVHGIAVLCLDGPLALAGPAQQRQIAERTLDTIIRGL